MIILHELPLFMCHCSLTSMKAKKNTYWNRSKFKNKYEMLSPFSLQHLPAADREVFWTLLEMTPRNIIQNARWAACVCAVALTCLFPRFISIDKNDCFVE